MDAEGSGGYRSAHTTQSFVDCMADDTLFADQYVHNSRATAAPQNPTYAGATPAGANGNGSLVSSTAQSNRKIQARNPNRILPSTIEMMRRGA